MLDRCLALVVFDWRRDASSARAIQRWETAVHAAPDRPIFHCGLAAAYRNRGVYHRACEVIDRACEMFPDDLGTTIETARSAQNIGRHDRAARYWGRVVAVAEPRPDMLAAYGTALVVLGRFDEAEALTSKALDDFPGDPALMKIECMIASGRQDWSKSLPLWNEYARRFPGDADAWDQRGRAIQGRLYSDVEAPADAGRAMPETVVRVKDEATRQFMYEFESLGDNCEFGMVQRHFGAEPLSLLRWNYVSPEDLIAALDANFEGMGEPENTEFVPHGSAALYVRDLRWGLTTNTYLHAGQVDPEAAFPKLCRKIVYLRNKLLRDLALAEKTFVYCSSGLDEERLIAMHRALRRHGPTRLLAVQPAVCTASDKRDGSAGMVRFIEPGCMVGYIDRLGPTVAGWDIAYDDWVAVCREAAAS